MELRAKLVVQGFMAGLHKSPYHGFSVEFAEHRQYTPGDDLKHLDWKVFARTDKHFVKQYEEETNLKAYILLDISKSMNYGADNPIEEEKPKRSIFRRKAKKTETNPVEGNISKLTYASYFAASLAYLMLMQKDAISLVTYDTKVRTYIPPHSTKTNLKLILKELAEIKPSDKTGTANSLNEIAEKIKRRGLVIIISDLLDKQSDVLNALKHFRYNKNEVIVFQILDKSEIDFIDGSAVTLKDIETGEEIYSQPYAIKKVYSEAMQEFLEKYKNECVKNNIDYSLVKTDSPFDITLLKYLTRRKRLQ